MTDAPRKPLILPHSIGKISRPPSVEDKPSRHECDLCQQTRLELATLGEQIARFARANQLLIANLMVSANLDKEGRPKSDDESPEIERARKCLDQLMVILPLPGAPQ